MYCLIYSYDGDTDYDLFPSVEELEDKIKKSVLADGDKFEVIEVIKGELLDFDIVTEVTITENK